MLSEILNNRIVRILIVALVVFGLCWLAKITFFFNAGETGVQVGITRS